MVLKYFFVDFFLLRLKFFRFLKLEVKDFIIYVYNKLLVINFCEFF